MQKLFFTILLVIAVLVAVRLYHQKSIPEASITKEQTTENTEELAVNKSDTVDDVEFEEENPSLTADEEETLVEE